MSDLSQIIGEIEADLPQFLKEHRQGDIPPATLRQMTAESKSPQVQLFLASYAITPANILESIYTETESSEVLCALAKHPHFNSKYMRQLAVHEEISVRKAVASSHCITPQTALALCGDSSAEVRATLARNNMIPARVQVQLSEDAVPFVRAALLSHSQLDSEVCSALAEDTDPTVQAAALLAQKTPEETLLFWADSDEHFPQATILMRKKIPERVLESLCFSSHLDVKLAAISRKILTADEMLGFAKDEHTEVRLAIAQLHNLPEIVQIHLSKDESKEVKLALAACSLLAPEAARNLLESEDSDIIQAVAANPNAPEEVLEELAEKGGAAVLPYILDKDCPASILQSIYEQGDEDTLYHLASNAISPGTMPLPLIGRLASHRLPTLRGMAASAANTPLITESILARDPSWIVRSAVARSTSATDSMREILAADDDARVRNAVKSYNHQKQIQ